MDSDKQRIESLPYFYSREELAVNNEKQRLNGKPVGTCLLRYSLTAKEQRGEDNVFVLNQVEQNNQISTRVLRLSENGFEELDKNTFKPTGKKAIPFDALTKSLTPLNKPEPLNRPVEPGLVSPASRPRSNSPPVAAAAPLSPPKDTPASQRSATPKDTPKPASESLYSQVNANRLYERANIVAEPSPTLEEVNSARRTCVNLRGNPVHHGALDKATVEARLNGKPVGSYFLHDTDSRSNSAVVLSVMTPQGVKHHEITFTGRGVGGFQVKFGDKSYDYLATIISELGGTQPMHRQ